MKKLILFLLVFSVSFSLFAVELRAGGAFNFVSGNTINDVYYMDEGNIDKSVGRYETLGLGFSVGGDVAFSDKISLWADFNMTFNFNFIIKSDNGNEFNFDDYYGLIFNRQITDDRYDDYEGYPSKAINNISAGIGVAYNFGLKSPLVLKAGAGFFYERVLARVKILNENLNKYPELLEDLMRTNLGVSLYFNLGYKFNDNIALGLTVMPHFGLYNILSNSFKKINTNLVTTDLENGLVFGFSIPVVLGASYSF